MFFKRCNLWFNIIWLSTVIILAGIFTFLYVATANLDFPKLDHKVTRQIYREYNKKVNYDRANIKKLENMVRLIPRYKYEENYQVYKQLLSYDPRNSVYLEKTRMYYHLIQHVLVITDLKKRIHMKAYPYSDTATIKVPTNTLLEVIGRCAMDDGIWYEVKWGKDIGWISEHSIVKGDI